MTMNALTGRECASSGRRADVQAQRGQMAACGGDCGGAGRILTWMCRVMPMTDKTQMDGMQSRAGWPMDSANGRGA